MLAIAECYKANQGRDEINRQKRENSVTLKRSQMNNWKQRSLSFNFCAVKAGEWRRGESCSCLVGRWSCLNKWEMRGQVVVGPRDQSKIWVESDAGSQGHQLNGRGRLPAADLWLHVGKLCPQARCNLSESKPAVTLSFGDAIQLERLTMVTLMAFKLPLKMWKLRRLNNSRQSICEACHSASRSHHSAGVCVAEVLTEGSPREAWGPDENFQRETSTARKQWRALKELTAGATLKWCSSGLAAANLKCLTSVLHDTVR